MASVSSMHEAGHSKLVFWDNPEGWGASGWGNTCAPVTDSCQCMAKLPQCCKEIVLQLNKLIKKVLVYKGNDLKLE